MHPSPLKYPRYLRSPSCIQDLQFKTRVSIPALLPSQLKQGQEPLAWHSTLELLRVSSPQQQQCRAVNRFFKAFSGTNVLLETTWVTAPVHDLGQVISPPWATFQPSPHVCLVSTNAKIIRAGLWLSQRCTQVWKQDKAGTSGSKNGGGNGEHKPQECFDHFCFENLVRK